MVGGREVTSKKGIPFLTWGFRGCGQFSTTLTRDTVKGSKGVSHLLLSGRLRLLVGSGPERLSSSDHGNHTTDSSIP